MPQVNLPKVAAITGGAQGIGRALALHFAREGYYVSLIDLNREAGFEVIRAIQQIGSKAMFMCADVADEQAVHKWLQQTIEDLSGLDVMINNAGISIEGSMLNLAMEDFDRVLSVNLRGTFLCSRYAARWMKQNGGGSIINIASTRAFMSEPNTEAYAASKGGVLALTHAMAVSLGGSGIRVNAISPGWIETGPWQQAAHAVEPQHSHADRAQHPVGRVGTPEDIAQACLFLADDQAAGFITGQNIIIDGGMTVKMIYE